jgi:hypothetical protein
MRWSDEHILRRCQRAEGEQDEKTGYDPHGTVRRRESTRRRRLHATYPRVGALNSRFIQ